MSEAHPALIKIIRATNIIDPLAHKPPLGGFKDLASQVSVL